MSIAISAKNVQKVYNIYHKTYEKYFDFFLPGRFADKFYALRDVSFEIYKGEAVGLVGLNGSGKSTLANIVAGVSAATSGELTIDGTAAKTSVSGGLVPGLTGIENIVQQGLLLGLTHRQINELTPGIIEFADIGPFIDQQVKTYSSGMRSKLAFSINVNISPDIMIIDEALSVGDPTFTQKCLDKMNDFRKDGKTIIFVSHSMQQVRDFCSRALWIEGGKLRMDGTTDEVVSEYGKFIKVFNAYSAEEKKKYTAQIRRRQYEKASVQHNTR